jgi:hypothetical protein
MGIVDWHWLVLLLFVRPSHLVGWRKVNVDSSHAVASPMCLSSLVACEKDLIMWRRDMWVRGALVRSLQGKGIIIITYSPRAQSPLATIGMDFLRGHYGHTKRMQSGYLRHYQVIVKSWMRDWWNVFSLCKQQRRAHACHATFFKSSLESHHAALECNKNV